MDLNFNKIFRSALKSKSKWYKKFVYWFCKHYFYCDIHPDDNIAYDVEFAHGALGVVINKNAKLDSGVTIQHHVTIGSTDKGAPCIRGGAYLGACCIVIGNIEIGEKAVVGAGCVVSKNVPPNSVVVGNPMRIIKGIEGERGRDLSETLSKYYSPGL